jgi:hypothetical protein
MFSLYLQPAAPGKLHSCVNVFADHLGFLLRHAALDEPRWHDFHVVALGAAPAVFQRQRAASQAPVVNQSAAQAALQFWLSGSFPFHGWQNRVEHARRWRGTGGSPLLVARVD